jgi:hypothetical protein
MKKVFIFLLVLNITSNLAGQVNLQTGSSNFSLPMFNWQDDNSRLNSVVALNYSSGNGLKVSELASNVGQGWRLIAGGVITRIQAGEPDDQKPRDGNGTPEDETKYPAGYLYDPVNASSGSPSALIKYPIYEDKNHIYKQHNPVIADKEQDRFAFQFNGKSGLFILGKNNGDKGLLIGDSKIKVWFTRDENMTYLGQTIRTTINAFYIQDEQGLIYKFAQREITKILKNSYTDGDLTAPQTQPNFEGNSVYHEASFDNNGITNPYLINGWYLTEIEDALTHRKITINYVTRNIDAPAGIAIAFYAEKNYSLISHSRSITQTPEIASIIYPDDHQVLFNFGDARIDLNGAYALASVDVKYQSRNIAQYQLTTSYFILNRYGVPVSEYQKKAARLCLLSVKKIGVDLKADDAPYYFDYNTGSSNPDDIVPPPFFHIKDIWGYYNGDFSHDYDDAAIPLTASVSQLSNRQLLGLCFMRNGSNTPVLNSKPNYAANGLLKKIVYPTGGTLSYNYAQNTALLSGQNTNVGGVHVAQTSVTDGGYDNDCTNPVVTNYTYGADASNTQSSLWGVEMPVNVIGSVSHYEPELKRYRWGLRGCGLLGCCKYKYQYPGIISREQAISLTSKQQTMQTLSDILDVVSAVSQVMDIVTVALGATGVGAILALVLDIIGDIINIVVSCFSDFSKDYYSTVYYNSDINAANPLPSQFKRVEVSESSGQNGKTVTEFTSPDDYPIWALTNTALSSKQRFAHWAYGLPKKTMVYDAAGNPVKQIENVYDTTYAKSQCYGGSFYDDKVHQTFYWGYLNSKALVKKAYSQRNTDWENPSIYNANYQRQSSNDLEVDMYGYCSGRTELKTSFERTFKQSNPSQYVETKTDYKYHNVNYLVNSVITTETNGDIKTKRITYADDHSDAAALGVLRANEIITPVTTSYSIIKNGSTQSGLLNETVTEFAVTANGDVKPSRSIERRFGQPFYYTYSASVREYYEYPGYANNPLNYKETQSLTYDATSKIVGMKDEGNRMVTNIYDYSDKYVTASVINADASLDKCAYTSFETQKLGGWVLSGAASYISNNAVTGSSSFALSGANSLTAPLNTAKPYRLSFWSTTAGIIVTGNATLVKSAPTINGFTYYEYSIAQGTSGVAVSGNGTIDELRLYPGTARMRTVTYDPVIGKTSECDENNRTTYYEYDEHGRLRFIKDDTKNIVKMYEYNLATKKQTGPCVTLYYNKNISETFTKNNCGAGYVGSKVTYTIPANRYSSTINQAVVDMQVQDELNRLGQSYANTNGTCIPIYYNTVLSQNFTKEGCPVGYKGTTVAYTVPANKYNSIISQADANAKAQIEVNANGQAYANKPGNATCIIDTEPDWIGTGETQCEVSNGQNTGKLLYRVIDQNPNSSSYNQTQWSDGGSNPTACPTASCSLSLMPGFSNIYNSISSSGGVVTFNFVLYPSSGTMQPGASYSIAMINGACKPSGVRTIQYSSAGRNWTISIYPSGQIDAYLNYGSPQVNQYSSISFGTINYNL